MTVTAVHPAPAAAGAQQAPTPARVLVTGAAGFIGSHLVDALLAAGHEVVGVDRRVPSRDVVAATNLAAALSHPAFTFTAADMVTDSLGAALAGCDTVFHLAAVPGVRASWGHRFDEYVTGNITATHRLLAACEQAGVRRLVFASSSSVYGPATGPSRESDPTAPISPYAITKLAAERLCLAHAHRADMSLAVTVLRYFTVYGPRQRPDMAIGRMLFASLSGVPVTLYGDGTQRREFTYVADAVAATIAAAHLDRPTAVVNVGGGASVTMIDVLRTAAAVTGNPVPLDAADPQPGDVDATSADLGLARALLGYEPAVGLRDGMARQVAWLAGLPVEHRNRYLPYAIGTSR